MVQGGSTVESLAMNNHFWRGRRVFLTGHTGFKGAWLSLWLQQLGANVTGYSLKPASEPSLFEVAGVVNGMQSIIGDVRDGNLLKHHILHASPDVVIHLAGQSLVRFSYENPVETYSTNVMGTINLLEAVRATSSVRATINVTTDKCYENREWTWGYRENDALGGNDPYSNSKACSELVSSAYRRSYSMNLATARAGNVIGGGDWAPDRLVPDVMRALARNEQVRVRYPNSTRPWQHVLEPLKGYLILAERIFNGDTSCIDAFNFGPSLNENTTVASIVEALCKKWGGEPQWQETYSDGAHEARQLKLDCTKAREILGWKTSWSLDNSLDAIVAWHHSFEHGADMRTVCHAQIDAYCAHGNENMN